MAFSTVRRLAIVALCALLAGYAAPAMAQQYQGRIDVTVEDSTGGRLPGVTIELAGPMNQTGVTDARARLIS